MNKHNSHQAMIAQQGYFIANAQLDWRLTFARHEFMMLFNRVSEANGTGKIADDVDIIRLYREHKPVWVKAYDQLRYLPIVQRLAVSDALLKLCHEAGLKYPVLGAKIVVRADMPNDDEWNFPPHQDYPFNRGSLNSVTVWVPFQDCGIEDGTLQVINQSHTFGELPEKDCLLIQPPDDDQYRSLGVMLGEALVFSQFLVHRSGYNRSDKVRFSMQVRFNDLADREYLTRTA
jgi:phytanoyl-CoA hydroxylase